MSSITVTHAPSGLVHANVARTERVTPHMVRVTLTGDDLRRFDYRGFDQWFRLAVPVDDHARFDNLPDKFDTRSYLRYLVLPKSTRPVIRNYTVRAFRRDELELDIDFVCHGTAGIAGPWAESVEPGTEVAFIDQGCGWAPVPADWSLLVADESGLPAVLGILRDMPRDAVGHAIVELIDAADAQDVDAPAGMTLHWVPRGAGGSALHRLKEIDWLPGTPYAFAVGESRIATGARRYLVSERGVPKGNVTFCGYWKVGKA
ncbi:siderophore-interacting protein [Cellulomonas humilata]|uniref:NADPH-dependent ferric siderophore reductase n=1 Tax=Cellulomonas humilata TaxID=144055 RepID=A0ABU0EJI0_9CELL|nr:siderophore-interacting protein [Cellulomonas humilata]MDQ0375436.1 NADPH-dependent ferric siderophore reductase [Cellulomonas humilata]